MVRGNDAASIGGQGSPEGMLSSDSVHGSGQSGVQGLVNKAREMPETINRVNTAFVGFVREQPLVALGAACALGYVMGRMLRRVV
jgi:hypothetical protein